MAVDPFNLIAYQYSLPEELIAKHPCQPRDASRLMLIERATGEISELRFAELSDLLQAGDSLVFNDAKVIPARLLGKRESGGATEILLVRRLSQDHWEAIGKPGRKLRAGSRVQFSEDFSCEIVEELEGGKRLVRLVGSGDLDRLLEIHGELPLPPYLHRSYDRERDARDYQTVFAKRTGAVAAPTAALHFSEKMLDALQQKGVTWNTVTLDVGLGTFQPVQVDDIREHLIHKESYHIEAEVAERLHRRSDRARQICVGTTTCRVLESAAAHGFTAGSHESQLFIYPGYEFRYVRTLLTNFHAPGSTLLMLVSAFAGYELIREAYAKAIERRFRFLSYGDAMLIL